jgi:hypothetical protein
MLFSQPFFFAVVSVHSVGMCLKLNRAAFRLHELFMEFALFTECATVTPENVIKRLKFT